MYFLKNLIQTLKITTFALFISYSTAHSAPTKISIIQNIEHPALNATRQGLIDELHKLGYKEGENLVLEYQSAQGNPSLAAQISQKYVSNQANMIVAIGTKAAQAAMNATKEAKIPVVFSSVSDPLAAKLVNNLKTPTGHVTGVSNFVEPTPQFQAFKKYLPQLKVLGVVYDAGEPNSIALNDMMDKTAKELGLKIVYATASKTSEVLEAARSLCGKVDAIFINNDNTALSAFQSVVKAAQECDIPAFVSDVDLFDQGAAVALGPDQTELGRQTARMVDFILQNPKAPLPSVEFPKKIEEHVRPR